MLCVVQSGMNDCFRPGREAVRFETVKMRRELGWWQRGNDTQLDAVELQIPCIWSLAGSIRQGPAGLCTKAFRIKWWAWLSCPTSNPISWSDFITSLFQLNASIAVLNRAFPSIDEYKSQTKLPMRISILVLRGAGAGVKVNTAEEMLAKDQIM